MSRDMAVPSSNYLLDIESTLFKEFDVDQDQVLDEIMSSSPKSILNLNCEDIPVDESVEDFPHVFHTEHGDMSKNLHVDTSDSLTEQSYLKKNHIYQTKMSSLTSDFDRIIKCLSMSDLVSPDFVTSNQDIDLLAQFTDPFLDFPIGNSLGGILNYSEDTLDEESIVLDDDSIVKILGDLNWNPGHTITNEVQSSAPSLVDASSATSTPIDKSNKLHSKTRCVNGLMKDAVFSTTHVKREIMDESQIVDKVPRVGRKSPTKSKRRTVRNKPNKCYHLYDFIREVLSGKVYPNHPRCVEWVDEEEKEFEIVNTVEFARLWGEMKNSKRPKSGRMKSSMTYEKVSRTLRYYSGDKLRILEKVEGKKCHFMFGTGNTWSKYRM